MYLSIFFLLSFSFFNQTNSQRIHPDDYKLFDNPYENDIESQTEDYNNVIEAYAVDEYDDNYKGIYYKSGLCCYRNYYHYGSYYNCHSNTYTMSNYTKLSNINDTNLQRLHYKGCYAPYRNEINIFFYYKKEISDSLVSVKMRLTNMHQEPLEFKLGTCGGYTTTDKNEILCESITPLDTYIIPSNSITIYTFKIDSNYYYLQKDNFKIPYPNDLFKFNSYVLIKLFYNETTPLILNSYIISVDLKRYVLSLSGQSRNSCSNHGCINYYCVGHYTGYYAYCLNSYYGEQLCSYWGCVPGAYCQSSSSICLECDFKCKGCTQDSTTCTSCYITSKKEYYKLHQQSNSRTKCPFEFYPLNKVESNNINVPIPLSHRMTFEFWIYIHDPRYLSGKDAQPSLSSFILQDFFTISVHQNINDPNSAVFVLTPFEFFYPFDKNYIVMDDLYNKYYKTFPGIQYVQFEIKNVTSRWIYVRGGISYPHQKMFINDKELDLNPFPLYYGNDKTNHQFLMRKFYRRYDTTLFKIQGFQYLGTDVYVRNFNLYSEYMYNQVNNPNYYNLHLIGDITTYPQLIFSIPFTDVEVDSEKLEINYKIYDFSDQLNEVTNNQPLITTIKSKLIRDRLAPSKNFYRLNFINTLSIKYLTPDLILPKTPNQSYKFECLTQEKKNHCYDEGQPFICNSKSQLMSLYEKKVIPIQENIDTTKEIIYDTINKTDLNIPTTEILTLNTINNITDNTSYNIYNENITTQIIEEVIIPTTIPEKVEEPRKNFSFCVTNCVQKDEDGIEHKFMRLPNIKYNSNQNDMCTYECDSSTVENCPSLSTSDIHTFSCKENKKEKLYSYFYHCLNDKKYPSNESALQFSGTLNTKSIIFPLNQNLTNFYIEMWFHPDLLTQEEKPTKTKYFFSTNNHHMYFDLSTQQLMLKAYNEKEFVSTYKLNQKLNYFGWNHFIFYVYEENIKNILYTKFSLSLTNNFIYIGLIEGKSTANKICFCNKDENCCDRLSGVTWMDLFIRDIKIWDSNFVKFDTINEFNKFNYVIPGGLIQFYNLTAASIDQNLIIDYIHPTDSSYIANFPSNYEGINPDNDMNYNIGWNFNWNDINYPKFIVSTKILRNMNRVQIIDSKECYEGCLKCYGINKYSCYSCQPGYALIGSTCIKTVDGLSIYYYLNPLNNNNKTKIVPELELDFASLNLSDYATLTLHFYIKIYGFTQEQIELYKNGQSELFKLITFSEESQFILYYNKKTDTIILKLGEKIQYSQKDIFSRFGKWIPISISAYRSDDLNFRQNFNSMTFDNTLLPYLGFDENNLYEYFPIETFKISKYLIAHFADVTLYDLFIINAYGYAQHKYSEKSKFNEKSDISRNKIIIKTFKMFRVEGKNYSYDKNENLVEANKTTPIMQNNLTDLSINISTTLNDFTYLNNNLSYTINNTVTTIQTIDVTNSAYVVSSTESVQEEENFNNSCIPPEDILYSSEIMNLIECKVDYLPYLDQNCKDSELSLYQLPNIEPICVANASKCDNIEQVTVNMLTNCDYLYASCDTKSLNSINNLIYTYTPKNSLNDKYIICGNALGLDLARFEPGTIKNIASPTNEFKMEFWFLSQSYVDNHFNSIIVEWTDHIKIEVFYNNISEKYGARCIPMKDEENMMEFEYIEETYEQNQWRYIVCGVNVNESKAYMTNLMVENRKEVTFHKSLDLTEEDTTLKISENSITNYGVTFIKELRLWKCYDCSSDKAFVKYSKDDPKFEDVIHYFKFESPTGLLQDYKKGYPESDISAQFITKTDFSGYGILQPIPDVPDCNEGGQMYYSIKKGKGCDSMINFNIFKEDIVFDKIPASRANRYTMEFWFFIESADNFTQGMNLIYEDHMTISTLVHNVNDTDIDVYCFPQAYRDHLDDTFGETIKERFDNAQNKAGYTYVNGISQWNYVRCAYSFDLLKYYINDEEPKNIYPEIFFNSYKNDKPFKMFMKNLVKLKINLSKDNFARVIIQTINIYRDYIPQTIKTQYLRMTPYITDVNKNPYYPILFSVNFPENYNLALDRLTYYVTDYEIIPEQTSLEHFLSDIELKSYKAYPIYETFRLCNVGEAYDAESKHCRALSSNNHCDKIKNFCLDNSKFFWCPNGKYLDINELICNSDCPEGYTRPPDIIDGMGMCYIKAADKHYLEYPRLNRDLKQDVYMNKFKCENGYTLVNYHCIPNDKISSSGIYFGSKYIFSNLIAYYNHLNINIVNYFVDFWFMYDLSGEYRFNIPNDNTRYSLFIAYPHFLSRYNNKIQYNNGYLLMDYYDVIDFDSIKYKWNHVVIENYQVNGKTAVDTFKYINIYWNNDYDNPKLSLKINNDNTFALTQIAFCHDINNDYSSCILGLNSNTYRVVTPTWDDAYYKDIKVWNRNATSISSINTFGSPLNNEITMNIISYHPLTIDSIQPGKIKSLVTFMNSTVDLVTEYNLEKAYDNSQQINWVTDFEITLPDNYILSINTSSYLDEINSPNFSRDDTSFVLEKCSGNCQRCFSGSEEDCISCKTPYLITGTKCNSITGFYFKVPTLDKNLDIIKLSEDISSYKEITITFYMKFLGTIEQRMGIVPILYFYQDKNYIGWDIEKQTFTINLITDSSIQTILSYNHSRLFVGKWSLYSVSIYKSDYQSIFPNMIQFMLDENIIQPEIDLVQLHKTIINYDYISINNKMNAVFYDLRIYNKFFIGANGIGQDIYSSSFGLPLLIKRFEFKSTDETSNDCAQPSDFNPSIGNNLQCIGDNNPFDEPNLTCESGEYKIIDAINNRIECNTCDSYCDINYCTSNTTKNCSCINDGQNYWLRYDFEEEKQKFYCEKLDSINLNEYNDIVIENIGIGTETGYMIEFWFYLETYIDKTNFQGVSIIWKHFLKIEIEHYQNNLIQIFCYPCSDNNFNITEKEDKYNTWVFYRCQVDKEKMIIKSPRKSSTISDSIIYSGSDTSTTLTIKDNSNNPYGVFLLRELRLYNARSSIIYDVSHLNLDITKYISLIHYYKGIFPPNSTKERNILYDSVKDRNISLTYKFEKYPYSYISQNYQELILCEEGFEYKKNPEGKFECLPLDKDELAERLSNDDTIFTVADLVSKIDNIYNMALGDYNLTNFNSSIKSQFSYDENGTIILNEQTVSDNFCSFKGQIKTVQLTPTCYCLGDAEGRYCHLSNSDYRTIQNMHEIFLTKAEKTYIKYVYNKENVNIEEENAFLSSLNTLILGNQLVAREGTFITEVTTWLNRNVIYNVNLCNVKYIEIIDNIFSNLISLTNFYKVGLIINRKGTDRDADLNMGQEEEIDGNILLIKKHIEYLSSLCFSDTVDGLWSYKSENIHIDLLKIPKNGNVDIDEKIKSLKIGNHEPYVQFGSCLNSIKSIDNSQYINIQIITWIYSPWYHHHILNNNYSSNYIEVKVYSDNLNELKLNECKDDSSISFYLTLINPFLTDIINNNKFHFKEGNIYKSDDPIFTEPKYILEDGSISTMSLQERRDTYYFSYLLIFKTLDEINRELIISDVLYKNLEDNSYFKCTSNHLSDFLLTYQYNKIPDQLSGRFYFLKHFKLYTNSENLKGNFGFFAIVIILGLYILNFLIVKLYLIIKKKKLGDKNYLLIEDFLVKYVYPYGNREDFFVNKDNMKKIYNNNLNLRNNKLEEKNINKIKIKQNYIYNETEIKTEKNRLNKNEAKNEEYLNEDSLLNYGDIKNKKLYEHYYKRIQKRGNNNEIKENNDENKDEKISNRNKKSKKEIFSSADNDSRKKNSNKENQKKLENYGINDDVYIYNENNEEVKEANDYNTKNKINLDNLLHSLQISNENLRVKLLSQIKINALTFFCINIKNRIIFINTFIGNYTYSASLKALCFPLYLELLFFFNTFIFITLEDDSNYSDYLSNNLGDFIWRCLLPVILVNVYLLLTRYFYNLDNGKLRKLLYELKTNKKAFDKHYFYVLQCVKRMMIIETIFFFIMIILSYIFSFGLFAVYPSQGKVMIISLICGIIIEIGLSLFLELLIAILIIFRKNHIIIIIIDYLNRFLSYKMLSP